MTEPIIHIANDEKFINSAIYQFQKVAPGRNWFHIVLQAGENKTKHVQLAERVNILENSTVSKTRFIKSIPSKSIVVFHSLSSRFHEIAYLLPKDCITVWFCFGYEVYNDFRFTSPDELLEPLTKKKFYIAEKRNRLQEYKDLIKPLARNLGVRIALTGNEKKKHAIKRINYLGSSFNEEFMAVSKKIKAKKKFFSFWYYPLERMVDISGKYGSDKNVIWIGNSGTISGNHIDVFEALKLHDLSKFNQVISPLSYGDKDYITEICSLGNKYFEAKFKPLRNFMPLEEYNLQLERAEIAIFNNKRQQALGNIVALLWMGCKVYLNPNNPIFLFLKRKGFKVFDFAKEFNSENSLTGISKEEKKLNQELLLALLKEEVLLENLKQQINSLTLA